MAVCTARPRRLNRAVSTDLKAVLDIALEKDRDRRYQTAALFADDLARILEGAPTLARPVGPMGRLLRWSRREPLKAALIGLVIVTLPAVATLITSHVKDRPKIEAARLARLEEDKDAILSKASFELAEGSPAEALRLFEQVIVMEASSPEAAAGKIMAHLRRNELESAQRTLDRYSDLLSGTASAVMLRADVLRAKNLGREAEAVERTAPDPRDALDHHLLAQRALDAGEREVEAGRDGRESFGRALSHATRAVLLSPGPRALLLEMRAHAAGLCKAREAAIETAAVLRARWPKGASAHFFAGFALFALEDASLHDGVIAALREAIQLKPEFAEAHSNLGTALFKNGLIDDAIAAHREAIRLKPHDAPTYAAYANLGAALSGKGLVDDAIDAYREAIRLRPDDAKLHSSLGNALSDKGLLDDAIAAHREAIRLRPDDAKMHSSLGNALSDKGLLDDAIAAQREAIRLRPDDAKAHSNLGNALSKKGLLDDAIAAHREVIRLRPDFVDAHSNLGVVFSKKGLVDDAIAAYREAIRLKPDHASAHTNLGDALSEKGLLDDAIAAHQEAIRLKPDLAEAHYNLGNALSGKGLPDDAITAYGEAIRLKPDYADAHSNLGTALSRRGLLDDAIAAYREAIRLKPDLASVHHNLGNALSEKGLPDEGIAAWREAIRLKSDFAESHYILGRALNKKGLLDDAIAAYREVIRLKPDYAPAHKNLGTALSDKGLLDDAVAAYRETVRLKPDDAEVHSNLGNVLTRKGLLDEAIDAYCEAIQLKPDDAMAHYNLGIALSMMGLLDDAIAAYREAIQLKPDHAETHCNLGLRLNDVGRFPEALASLRRGHELGSRRAGWSYHSAEWVVDLERLVAEETASEARLRERLASGTEPEDPAELARLAKAALRTGRALIAARWYQLSFERNPRLAGATGERHRFHAACAAAKAAAADGASASTWRKQALVWLSEDLDTWEERLESGRVKDADLRRALAMWQHEETLASVRGDAISSLPKPEQESWNALWKRVARILAEL